MGRGSRTAAVGLLGLVLAGIPTVSGTLLQAGGSPESTPIAYQALNLLLQFLDDFAFIVLAAAGLAVIFGIMGVINLAHGEFIMVGAYGTTLTANAGAPLPVAMLVGVLAAAVVGFVIERVIISGAVPNWISQHTIGRPVIEPLYDRLFDSMVATWGVSLVMIEGGRLIFGDSLPSIGTPLGSIHYGAFSTSIYSVVLAGASVLVMGGVFLLFTRTGWGRRARATIQDEPMARSLGVNTNRTYMTTFAVGSGLAGLTGALYAPTLSIGPGLGSQFLVDAFVAVVVGGTSVILGTLLGGGILAAISATVDNLSGNSFFGRIALLVFAIVVLRFLPTGVSGLVERLRERREVTES